MTSAVAAHTGRIPVLMYHSISDTSTAAFRSFVVPPRLFENQVGRLAAEGWQAWTMSQVGDARRRGEPLPERVFTLTFDDGYRDFLTTALPILNRHSLTATLYAATGYVGGTSRWLRREGEQNRQMLSWHELSEVAASGVECGAHTHSHPQLDRLARGPAAREIQLSKVLIEDHLGHEVRSLAYPFGYANRAVRELVQQSGFSTACTVGDLVSEASDDPYCIPRLTVTPEHTPEDVAEMLQRSSSPHDRALSWSRGRASYLLRRTGLRRR